MHAHRLAGRVWQFEDLKTLLARATPLRSGDVLAGVAAASAEERMAARLALADLPLQAFLSETVVPYEDDEVTRLIVDSHDAAAFAPVAHLTVGGFRDWLLSDAADPATLRALAPGLMPEMVAAVSKLMRNQDLLWAAKSATSPPPSATPSACPATWRCGCSRTIPPTTRRASRPRCSTG